MAKHALIFELYYDGVWNAAPVYVRDGCTIMRGIKARGDSDPATASLTLDNRAGLYSPRSVASPLYGKIGQNTRARLTVDDSVRLVGEVASWAPERAIKGDAWTRIEVAGVLRRIGQGTDPLEPPAQRVTLIAGPSMFLPFADGRSATVATDIIGGPAMPMLGAPQMAAVSGPGAGDTLHPELIGASGYAGGFRGPTPNSTTGEWTVEFGYRATTASDNCKAIVAQWRTTGTEGALTWLVYITKSAGTHAVVLIRQHDLASAAAMNLVGVPLVDGEWHQIRVSARQNSPTQIHIDLVVDGFLQGSNVGTTNTIGNVTELEFGDYTGWMNGLYPFAAIDSLSVAYAATWPDDAPISTYDAFTGYVNELAADRFTRFCGEQDITSTVVGTAAESVRMGPQRSTTRLELFDEIARTDDASIFETRDSVGLTMRTGDSKLNQAPDVTISYLGQIRPPLKPVIGDVGIRNDVTGAAPTGATARVQQLTGPRNVQLPEDDPQGVGRYATRIDVNPVASSGPADAAGWRVNHGTFDGTAYAEITADLDAAPGIAATAAALDIGDVLAISSLPVDEALETVESVIVGIKESVLSHRRLITFYCVPAAPYQVGLMAATSGDTDPFLGHLETDDSTTTSSVAVGAASFSVTTNSGPIWTISADDFPFDVVVGGQRVSISGISGGSSPQTFTVQSAATGGKQVRYAIAAGSAVTVQQPIILAL